MTDAREIALELIKLDARATPGEWETGCNGEVMSNVPADESADPRLIAETGWSDEDANFIAYARNHAHVLARAYLEAIDTKDFKTEEGWRTAEDVAEKCDSARSHARAWKALAKVYHVSQGRMLAHYGMRLGEALATHDALCSERDRARAQVARLTRERDEAYSAGAAAEREACAKLFDDEAAHARALKESCKRAPNNSLHGEMLAWHEREMVAVNAADAIRARKEESK